MRSMRRTSATAGRTGLSHLEIGVAEGSRTIVDLVRNALAMQGIRNVRRFARGTDRACLAQLMAAQPGILVMNAVDGFSAALEMVRAIRDRDSSLDPFMAIVVVMANVTRERVLRARDAGVDEFLAFPFTPKALHQRIVSIVEDRRGFVDTPTYFGPDRRRGAMAHYLGAERRGSASTLINPKTREPYIEIA